MMPDEKDDGAMRGGEDDANEQPPVEEAEDPSVANAAAENPRENDDQLKVRSDFPETWLWSDTIAGYLKTSRVTHTVSCCSHIVWFFSVSFGATSRASLPSFTTLQ